MEPSECKFLKKSIYPGAEGAGGIFAILGPSKGQIQGRGLDFPIMELVSAELAVPLSAGRLELSWNSELDCSTFHTVPLSLGLGELVSWNIVFISFE